MDQNKQETAAVWIGAEAITLDRAMDSQADEYVTENPNAERVRFSTKRKSTSGLAARTRTRIKNRDRNQ